MSEKIRCPVCKGPLKCRNGRLPTLHLSFIKWQKHTLDLRSKPGSYYHCLDCGRDFMKSLVFVEIDLEKMVIKQPFM